MTNRIVLNETFYYNAGAIQGITNEARVRGFKKAFICSDPDLVKFNATTKVTKALKDAGLAYGIYSSIKLNPAIGNVWTGVVVFRTFGVDYIIAVGGGSSMDTFKAIDIIITSPEFEDVRSLEGVAPTKNPYVPITAIPITAGMAAEVTINYVIMDAGKKRKLVCVDTHDIPVVIVVDPEMMASMPRGLAAVTGMGTLTHAIEGHTTKGAWEMTDMFNLKATEAITHNLGDTVENKPRGREDMVLGQYLTGVGLSSCGLGIVRSMAHGLGALYDIPHGVANAIIPPTVTEHSAPYTGTRFKDIVVAMGVEGMEDTSQEEYREAAVDAVRKLSQDVKIPADLKEIAKPEDVDFLS